MKVGKDKVGDFEKRLRNDDIAAKQFADNKTLADFGVELLDEGNSLLAWNDLMGAGKTTTFIARSIDLYNEDPSQKVAVVLPDEGNANKVWNSLGGIKFDNGKNLQDIFYRPVDENGVFQLSLIDSDDAYIDGDKAGVKRKRIILTHDEYKEIRLDARGIMMRLSILISL